MRWFAQKEISEASVHPSTIVSPNPLVALAGRARDHFPYGGHFQEYLARRRIGDIACQFSHQRFGSFEGLARARWTISRRQQPPQRGVISPLDQGHRVCCERLQGSRQLFLSRHGIAIHRGDFAQQPPRNGDVLGSALLLRVGQQRSGVLLSPIQLAPIQPILGLSGIMANSVKPPAGPALALVQRQDAFEGLLAFPGFSSQEIVVDQVDERVRFGFRDISFAAKPPRILR